MSKHCMQYKRDASNDKLLVFLIGSAVGLSIILLIIAGILIATRP